MRLFQRMFTGLCLLFLFGFLAATAMSSEMTDPVKAAYSSLGNEAIVTKIESGSVTLQSTTYKNKEFMLAAKYVGDVRVGDKVRLDNNSIRRLEGASKPEVNEDTAKQPQSVEQPASTLDQNPKPGTQP